MRHQGWHADAHFGRLAWRVGLSRVVAEAAKQTTPGLGEWRRRCSVEDGAAPQQCKDRPTRLTYTPSCYSSHHRHRLLGKRHAPCHCAMGDESLSRRNNFHEWDDQFRGEGTYLPPLEQGALQVEPAVQGCAWGNSNAAALPDPPCILCCVPLRSGRGAWGLRPAHCVQLAPLSRSAALLWRTQRPLPSRAQPALPSNLCSLQRALTAAMGAPRAKAGR